MIKPFVESGSKTFHHESLEELAISGATGEIVFFGEGVANLTVEELFDLLMMLEQTNKELLARLLQQVAGSKKGV